MLSKLISSILLLFTGFVPHKQVVPTPTPSNPYFISSMQQRKYDSDITTERQILSTSQYVSYQVSFVSDGLKEYALMNIPRGKMPPSGWPVVILNHGHIAPDKYSTADSYKTPAADFARAGFLVLKPDYRGHGQSAGYADGLLNRLDYAIDVLNLLEGAKKLPQADRQRFFMWGHSMGGDVSVRVLEICGTCVRSASLWAPAVTSWPESMLYFVRRNRDAEWLNRVQSELSKSFSAHDYSRVSVMDNLQLIKVPLNLHHGTADESVPYSWGEALSSKLTEQKIIYTFYIYKGDNHNLTGSWNTAISRDVQLFNFLK